VAYGFTFRMGFKFNDDAGRDTRDGCGLLNGCACSILNRMAACNLHRTSLLPPSYPCQPRSLLYVPPAAPPTCPLRALAVGPITSVVWSDPGGTTHNYAIGHRMQQLPFKVVSQPTASGPGILEVAAPANANAAPPGFYLVFLVAGDLYSDGIWVQIREPPPKPLAGTISPSARLVSGISADFEGAAQPPPAARVPTGGLKAASARFKVAEGGPSITLDEGAPEAAASGASGLRVTGLSGKVRVLGPAAQLAAGKECTLMLWARSVMPDTVLEVGVAAADGKSPPALAPQAVRPSAGGAHCLFTLPAFKPVAAGAYQVQVSATLSDKQPGFDIDDIEMYCLP
jgi:hypothetical protein